MVYFFVFIIENARSKKQDTRVYILWQNAEV